MGSCKIQMGSKSRRHQKEGAIRAQGANGAQIDNGLQPQLDLGADGALGANGAQAQLGRIRANVAKHKDDDTLSSQEEFILHEAGPVTDHKSAMAPPRPKYASARVLRTARNNSPVAQ